MKKAKYFFVFLVLAILSFIMFLNLKKEPVAIFFVLVLFWSMVMVFFAFIKEVFNEKNN